MEFKITLAGFLSKWGRKQTAVVILTLLLMSAGILIIFQPGYGSGKNSPFLLQEFTENEVSTQIKIGENSAGVMELSAIFTPSRPQFHLYSKNLPENGLNGLGRPTLVKILSSDGIYWLGPLTANQPEIALYIQSLGLTFPVYPDGPVRLSLPYKYDSPNHPGEVKILITYMACSDQTCLPPVINRPLNFEIPFENQT